MLLLTQMMLLTSWSNKGDETSHILIENYGIEICDPLLVRINLNSVMDK